MKIVSVGEITLDHYLGVNQTHIGGISLNFAVHAKRSGATSLALISRVGEQDGQIVLDKLEQEGVNKEHVKILDGKTASIDIQVLENADRIFPEGGYHENVLANFTLSPEEIDFIQKQDVLTSYFSARKNSHFSQLKALNFTGKRSVDFGDWSSQKHKLEPFLAGLAAIDLAFISGNEETIDLLLPYASKERLIVVTLGEKGSVSLKSGKQIYQEAIKVPRVFDTTGCGDAFQAAFSVYYLATGDIQGALLKGAKQAARVLVEYGATRYSEV